MKTNRSSLISFPNSPTYDFIFPFEERFNFYESSRWLFENRNLCFYIAALYLSAILAGKYYMKNRSPLKVRKFLILWNVVLSIFSLMGTYRTVPELVYVLNEYGLHHSICTRINVANKISGFWGLAFAFSKLPELVDTAFVIARKQKLVVLHWFHHVVTLCICWYVSPDFPSMSRWMMCINFSIHAVMYAYYACRAMGYAVSRSIALFITTTQILQMVLGLLASSYVALDLINGGECQMSVDSVAVILFGYSTFFVLFLNFFFHSYVLNKITMTMKNEQKKNS